MSHFIKVVRIQLVREATRSSCSEHLASCWELRCYEAKIEESEKASSRLESNPGHPWLELPVLCHWSTTAGQPPPLTILYNSLRRVKVKNFSCSQTQWWFQRGFWGFWKLLRFIQFQFPKAACSVCIRVHYTYFATNAQFSYNMSTAWDRWGLLYVEKCAMRNYLCLFALQKTRKQGFHQL